MAKYPFATGYEHGSLSKASMKQRARFVKAHPYGAEVFDRIHAFHNPPSAPPNLLELALAFPLIVKDWNAAKAEKGARKAAKIVLKRGFDEMGRVYREGYNPARYR